MLGAGHTVATVILGDENRRQDEPLTGGHAGLAGDGREQLARLHGFGEVTTPLLGVAQARYKRPEHVGVHGQGQRRRRATACHRQDAHGEGQRVDASPAVASGHPQREQPGFPEVHEILDGEFGVSIVARRARSESFARQLISGGDQSKLGI